MNKTKKTKGLLASVGLAIAATTATLTLASEPAHADPVLGCTVEGSSVTVPVGNEWIDGDYTVVIYGGKVYHRHQIYRCAQTLQWEDTGRYVDLEIGGEIGCCPKPGGHGEILT